MIFVFGSNEAGVHGAGAAQTARIVHGAMMGCGYGHVSNSFAIPTKDRTIQHTLSLDTIEKYVQGFIAYATGRPNLTFQVTRIGCGLAGLKDVDVAPLFFGVPENCFFDEKWRQYLGDHHTYWGTF
ncbi:hypothetical protein [Caballeronia sp. TF1N1]|uniref:A1S_2505 family phage non-structural protein n=1 Tax=Caballeronia sp. TF1N1 TaxID=2878153 RepID=UPI001FD39794|nr:hypothetical protein [Caballeronia sp. TF1N1]